MKRRIFRVSAERTGELAAAVSAELEAPLEDARTLVRNGAVYVDGRRSLAPERRVEAGKVVSVVLEESGRSALAESALPPVRVLYEEKDFLAVDKPAGVPTQPTPGRAGDSLADAVSAHLRHRAGLVHRLDRDTSGVVLFGKTPRGTSALAAAFRRGDVRKVYLAVTGPGLEARGVIELPLSRDPKRPGRFRATRAANGVPAVTEYERLHAGDFCVVLLRPKTGRTHQLRAHLTAAGAPIAGDKLYGGSAVLGGISAPRCLLHAWAIEVPSGSGARAIDAAPPGDLRIFLEAARLRLPSPFPESTMPRR